ncbi:MAG: hypothetical protein HZB54_04440 [Deltaproteobacteria bacterium]|nr:hypothetical protein [Deltaproteobacteria bacterium]
MGLTIHIGVAYVYELHTPSLISIDNSSLIAVSYLKRMIDDIREKPLKFKKLDNF